MVDKNRAKQLRDFVAEAEEILESLAEDLEKAQEQFEATSKVKPDRLNKIFREMHSLKGLASMFNLDRIATLSHDLESLLDRVRLGKAKLDAGRFSVLNDSRIALRSLVSEAGEGEETTPIDQLLRRLAGEEPTQEKLPRGIDALLLDEPTRKSLTEYEEHRLRENIEEENHIFAIQVGFDFSDFDQRLRQLTEQISECGEVISTLPVVDPGLTGGIHFRLLFGTRKTLDEVSALVGDAGGAVSDIMPATVSPRALPEETSEEPDLLPGEGVEQEAEDARGLSNTVKVDIEKLDTVMGIVGELNLVKAVLERIAGRLEAADGQKELSVDLFKQVRSMDRKLNDLQRAIIDIRLVPIGQIFNKLNRTARRLARQAGKVVRVELYGGETELDKMMMDQLVTPLIHLIRNSIDHGLEPPGERRGKGKSEEGTLAISAYQKGNSILIEVTDDGRGLQLDRIREAAVRRGLADAKQALSPEECLELIFLPGFSSAETVTEVSGRGVGLDAVKASLDALKGSIAVWSEPDRGTTFQVTLPITLAIIQSLIVGCCDQLYAIPISSVVETFRVMEEEIQRVDQREVFNLRGVTLPLLRLEERFKLKRTAPKERGRIFVVVARRGERVAGIVVDDLLGEQETVVHPLGERFGKVAGVAGATEVGENQVILVIDTVSLFGTIEAVKA
jgi:two-component system chemotaxis sensor kinase CheA